MNSAYIVLCCVLQRVHQLHVTDVDRIKVAQNSVIALKANVQKYIRIELN